MTQGASGRRPIYFNEFNVLMDKTAYLPLVSGLLRAYAQTQPDVTAAYEFRDMFFCRDNPKNILARYREPAVAAFSVSMWNEQLNLAVAASVKAAFPDCLIVFGGPHVPHDPADYFAANPFIDVAVRGEGEQTFVEILRRALVSRDFSGIGGMAWRDPSGRCVRNPEERDQPRDLDLFPSPYLEGLFDSILRENTGLSFQAIVETNRGCPFPCTFCFWGMGGLSRKYRFMGMDRVTAEFEWMAKNKIRYVFNADSNFGMLERDMDIAKALVETKKRWGFPDKFRTCFGKNTDDKIYDIAMLLHANGLEKGITLARQSNDAGVLENIRRSNIKLSTYENLQLRFNEGEVPVYSELILGLPGETYESWIRGIEELLRSGLKNQLFTYFCQVYPNTELASPDHRKKFGIVTRRIKLTEIHAAVRDEGETPREFEEIVVKTDSMPTSDWRRMALFSWVIMLLHSLKLGYFVMIYLADRHKIPYTDFLRYVAELRMPFACGETFRSELAHFDRQLDRLLDGHGRGHVLERYGGIYWDEEEASFLRVSERLDKFYSDLRGTAAAFLTERGVAFDPAELDEAVAYQRLRIPTLETPKALDHKFRFSLPEFFETRFKANPAPLREEAQSLKLKPRDFGGDPARYARETILWGRKSGTMLVPVEWGVSASTTAP